MNVRNLCKHIKKDDGRFLVVYDGPRRVFMGTAAEFKALKTPVKDWRVKSVYGLTDSEFVTINV